MWPFKKRKLSSADYTTLITQLQQGDNVALRQRLAFYGSVTYLPATEMMLEKMRRPDGDDRSLSLHQVIYGPEFELAIFNVPWGTNLAYLPLILHSRNGGIYGIMLAFNELHDQLSHRQQAAIGKLGVKWTGFAVLQHLQTNKA